MLTPRLAIALTVLVAVAAGQGTRYTPETAPAELQPAVQKADQALTRLRDALMARLTEELGRGDALTAVSACHQLVPEVAADVRREVGIELGRTSHRLRNRQNQAPAWGASHVEQAAGKRAADVEPLVVDLGDRVGVMRPIPMQGMCAGCHGPDDRIGPDVRESVMALYPGDRATGFREGDLRGWMWAEVKKQP